MASTPSRSLIDLILIERGVYVRVLDLDYQAEQFEVFHTWASTRWIHYLGTQLIVGAFLVAGWNVSLGGVALAPVLMGLLGAWYVAMHRTVGLVASAQVLVLGVASFFAARAGVTATHAIVTLGLAALAQNLSHSVEPVPPMLTGRHFEPFPVFWRQAPWRERVRLLALNTLYAPLELVSAPRLFAVHVLRAMHRLGFAPGWASDVRTRAARILEGER
ncbi:MAG: hypothetical protein SFW67_04610 [Myxococcaceae bacterium]|nr:hypothetical protein [Myxococcaceae bacterium]